MFKRLSLLWTVLRGDARRRWFALRHPLAPGWFKLGVALAVVYLVSPLDFVPDFIPFFGAVDDLVLVPLALRGLLQRLPPDVARAAAERAAR